MTDQPETPSKRSPKPWLALIGIGLAWGATGPFSKLAVSTGNHPMGITFWDVAICAAALSLVLIVMRKPLPLSPTYIVFYAMCGLLGTVLPNAFSYAAYVHLSVGVNVIILSLVPMMTMLLALPFRIEHAEPRRLAGLTLGFVAVLMIALPDTSLPDPSLAVWVLLPVAVALCYSGENVYMAIRRPPGIDPLQIITALSWAAMVILIPLVLISDAWVDIWRWDPPEQAIVANAVLHVAAYTGFIWLIGHAGPVFAAQVGYIVTGSGVILGMIVYDERHSLWVWGALALIFVGLSLVKPRRADEIIPGP